MSLYANSSEQYWNSRKKSKENSLIKKIIPAVIAGVLLASVLYISSLNGGHKVGDRKLMDIEDLPQPNVTREHHKKCEAYFKNNQNQCLSICNDQRKKHPRPTMHQACMHGCNNAYSLGSESGCKKIHRGKASNDVGKHGYKHCAKYQNMLPKPEIFSVCRKYHTVGGEQGFIAGEKFINDMILSEWDRKKEEMRRLQHL
uniref:Uncharacterized protein n=1 Tax=Leptocylindrus danicus TaxID=163516 RepID=A0A7S2LGP0_9STRA|mmetsp:Transcript_542/g.724  ORF Transcript_542/g.724 Transcript_542/m.724 type:complete len:200 (+) Transcript_542:163-762(+)